MAEQGVGDHRLGWVGTGRMGYPLAHRLLEAGCDLTVYNRTRSKAEPLAELGARIVDTPAELADRDIVFTMVSGNDDLREVALGPDGLLAADVVQPSILVDSSTVSAEVSSEIGAHGRARGTALLAAPVSGNPKVVRSGRLTFVVSGPEEAYETARPYFEVLGRGVTYVGGGEAARLVKICHNLMLGVVAQSMAEITVLAEKGGVSRADFLAFLNDSVMGSTFSRYKAPGLHSHVHPAAVAKGLRSRARGGARARRSHACGCPRARDRAVDDRQRKRRRRFREAPRASGNRLRPRAEARGHRRLGRARR